MVVESLISPWKMENRPAKMIILGFLYCSIALFLSLWVFRTHASLIMVFLATLAAVPLMYSTIKIEEEKDLTEAPEKKLLKEHSKALTAFMYLFLGMTLAFTLWYTVLPSDTVGSAFKSQTETINQINGGVTGLASSTFGSFSGIFLNNMRVLMFCIIFSFLYGSGAIFILTWNASVIGAAMGDFIRHNLSNIATATGAGVVGEYFSIISVGLTQYILHGVPEILAYFTAGLAGGIISVAVIKHDFGSKKFEHVVLDSADLLIISIFMLLIAAFLEVFVTPAIF